MEAIINYFLQPQNGLLGVVVAALLFVVIWQQRRLDKKDTQIADLQDKRKADTDAYTASYTTIAKEQISTTKDAINTLNLLQRSLDSLANSLQSFLNK